MAGLNLGDLFSFLKLNTDNFDKGLEGAKKEVTTFEKTLSAAATAGTVAFGALAAGAGLLAKGAIEAGAEFEGFDAQLTTLLGSADAAAQRLNELKEIGATTPFELAGLVKAETVLAGFGDKAGETRQGMLNFAASLDIDVVEAANAVGRAFAGGAGAADVLRERGVIAMLEIREGVKASELSIGEFRDALKTTLEEDFAGGVERAAATFSGQVSNLEDRWGAFQLQIADATAFDATKAALGGILDLLKENESETAQIADNIGTGITAAIMIAITSVGSLVDLWDGVLIGVQNVELGISEMETTGRKVMLGLLVATTGWLDTLGAAPLTIALATQKIIKLNAELIGSSTATQKLVDEQQEMVDNFGRGFTTTNKINRELEKAIQNQGKFTSEVEVTNAALKETEVDFDAIAKAAQDLSDVLGFEVGAKIELDFDDVTDPFKDALERLGVDFDEAAAGLARVESAAVAFRAGAVPLSFALEETEGLFINVQNALTSLADVGTEFASGLGVELAGSFSTVASSMLDLSKAGFALAGPIGAAAGALVALVSSSDRFAGIQESLDESFQKIANVTGKLLIVVEPIVEGFESVASSLANNIGPALRALAEAVAPIVEAITAIKFGQFEKQIEALGKVFAVVSSAVEAVASPIRKVIERFQKVSEVFKSIISVISGVFNEAASGVVGGIVDFVKSLDFVQNAFSAVQDALGFVSGIIEDVVSFVTEAWNNTLDVIIGVVEKLDDAIPGTQNSLERLAASLNDLKFTVDRSNDATGASQSQIDSHAEALALLGDETETSTEGFAALNEELLNAPAGFKIATARFAAMDAELGGLLASLGAFLSASFGGTFGAGVIGLANGGVVTSPTLAVIGEAGPEAVVPLDRFSQQGGGLGGGGGITFTGPVTVVANDPEELMRNLNKLARRRGATQIGSSAGIGLTPFASGPGV